MNTEAMTDIKPLSTKKKLKHLRAVLAALKEDRLGRSPATMRSITELLYEQWLSYNYYSHGIFGNPDPMGRDQFIEMLIPEIKMYTQTAFLDERKPFWWELKNDLGHHWRIKAVEHLIREVENNEHAHCQDCGAFVPTAPHRIKFLGITVKIKWICTPCSLKRSGHEDYS